MSTLCFCLFVTFSFRKIHIITMKPDGSVTKLLYPQYISSNASKNIVISLVVPAYNEEKRLPIMLNETIDVKKALLIH